MKRCFFLLLCVCHFLSGLPIQDRRLDPDALSELALALGIPPDANLIEETQKRWLRSPNQERWEMQELSPEQKEIVLDWGLEQGLFAAWTPLYQEYDKACILGATTCRMQMRLDYLKKLWEEGIRFKEIVWLTGDRPLDPRIDSLTDRCETESEAAHILWEETALPEEMRASTTLFIAVPMKQEGSIQRRPNTADTIVSWLETNPLPCSALFISDQPFCGYQFAILKTILPDNCLFDVVGPAANPRGHSKAAAITLDSLARQFYQEQFYRGN